MTDEKLPPGIAIGHVTLTVSDIHASARFYRALGLRPIWDSEKMAILELRGGTHLLLFPSPDRPEPGPVRAFDFMVEDIETAHAAMKSVGIEVSAMRAEEISGHRGFEITDPDGRVLKVFSSHTEGRPV